MKDQSPMLPFLAKGIAQVAFVVRDLEKTVENYWKIFGIGPWHFYTYGKPLVKKMSYKGKSADYSMRIALSYIGDLRIELIEMMKGNTIYADSVKEHGFGFHHFGILVDDMDDAIAQAEKAGYRIIQDGSGFGRDGDGHYAYIDTEEDVGVTLELIQRPAGRAVPEKIYPPGG
jgi:catechol 2,3-dioxygenase-like lactoylglutathione lyase family enzyme